MIGEGAGALNNAGVLRTVRRTIKAERADALMLGEHFHQADAWLQGDQEDGAMNYWGFTRPLWAWIAGRDFALRPAAIDGREFMAWATEALAAVPYDVQLACWNHLGSHDVPRLFSAVDGDVDRLTAAVALQFAWPGVPCVYYGDEVGLHGGPDPDNRRCFPWARADWREDVLALHRAAVQLRRRRTELQTGAWLPLASHATWIAFARFDARAASVCVVARDAPPGDVRIALTQLPLELSGTQWRPAPGFSPWPAVVTGDDLVVTLGGSGAILLSADAGG
jgi:alpha-glucosidase